MLAQKHLLLKNALIVHIPSLLAVYTVLGKEYEPRFYFWYNYRAWTNSKTRNRDKTAWSIQLFDYITGWGSKASLVKDGTIIFVIV